MPEWALYLLGPPRLEQAGRRVEVGRRKVLALLIYLAASGRAYSRDSLAAFFWPEHRQADARAALRRTLSELLKILGGRFIQVEQDTIQWEAAEDFWLDTRAFHERLNAYRTHGHHPNDPCPDCLAALSEATELFQDEFLAGFSLGDCLDFDEWQILQSEILHCQRVEAWSRLTFGQAANGEIETAIGFARRWLEIDSVNEVAHRQLMQLLAWSGKRAEALRQYQECARILERELDAAPQKETTALYEQLRTQDEVAQPVSLPSPRAAPRPLKANNLPVQLTSLVGQAAEMRAIGQELSRPEVHLLTLTGPGGVGKTRLSIEVAAQLGEDFEQGVFFVSLAALQDATLVPAAIAHVLGVQGSKHTSLLETLKTYLRDRQILLILDNFEHLAPAAPLVTELLSAAPGLKVLVTSRNLLHVYGEHLHPILPLKLPKAGKGSAMESLAQADAVRLFIERAQAVESGLNLAQDSIRQISEICTRLDGLPLAIELAAARVSSLSPRAMLEQWAGEAGRTPLQTLTHGPRDRPDRHKTLRNAIAWSYNLLEPGAQRVFRHAGVFAGGLTPAAAAGVTRAAYPGDIHLAQGEDSCMESILEELADSHLLEGLDQPGEKRYAMLETIREYALEQLAASKEIAAAQECHARHFLGLAESARNNLLGSEQASWINRLAREYDNLRTALIWGITHQDAALALRLVAALGRFWYLYDPNYWREGRTWLEKALNLPASEATLLDYRAKALNEAGVLAWAQADYPQAVVSFEACLELKKKLGDRAGVGSALGNLGLVAREQLDLAQARKYQEQSLAVRRELGDKGGIATTLGNLGLVAADLGEWRVASNLYEESIQINRELQNRSGLGSTLHNLGGLLVENKGDCTRARALLEESLAISRELSPNFFLIPYTLHHLGSLALYQEDFSLAREYFEQSFALAGESGNKFGLGYALYGLGYLSYLQHEDEKAVEYYRQSLRSLQEVDGQVGMLWNLLSLAGLACRQGHPRRAATLLGASQRLQQATSTALPAVKQEEYQSILAATRACLSEADFDRGFAEGQGLATGQAIAYAAG